MLGDRPLVIYDVETTGLDKSKDQIIQIALVKYDWNIKKIIDSKNYYIQPEGSYSIPIGAYMVHHINAEFLKDKPHFREVASTKRATRSETQFSRSRHRDGKNADLCF